MYIQAQCPIWQYTSLEVTRSVLSGLLILQSSWWCIWGCWGYEKKQ